jgi:ADP-ribosylglycohydrolase
MELLDRFKGCILGCAVGDALGMPVERLTREQIRETYGRVTDYMKADPRTYGDLHTLKPGQYTDDTLLTCALAESLIEREGVDLDDIARKHVELYQREPKRGWGRATKAAFEQLIAGVPPRESGQPSCGNGTAMKIAPLGLWYAPRFEMWELLLWSYDIASITHRDPHARGAAAFQAWMVRDLALLQPRTPDTFAQLAEATAHYVQGQSQELHDRLRAACRLVRTKAPIDEAVARLGTSGNVLESIPAALYFAGRTPHDFEATVTEAANAGRDTDTVAAMAGALIGAHTGLEGIPRRFLDGLDNRTYLEDLATRLYHAAART